MSRWKSNAIENSLFLSLWYPTQYLFWFVNIKLVSDGKLQRLYNMLQALNAGKNTYFYINISWQDKPWIWVILNHELTMVYRCISLFQSIKYVLTWSAVSTFVETLSFHCWLQESHSRILMLDTNARWQSVAYHSLHWDQPLSSWYNDSFTLLLSPEPSHWLQSHQAKLGSTLEGQDSEHVFSK